MKKHGSLPAGVYVTYDHAMFRTGSLTSIPRSWSEKDRDPEKSSGKRWGMRITKVVTLCITGTLVIKTVKVFAVLPYLPCAMRLAMFGI
jgi:hypothetical protein